MPSSNQYLKGANKARKDEFYTLLQDIEKEIHYYRKHFQGKTVFCNCDDPFESNFFKYFVLNFNRLGLKKLIATSYVSSPIANRQLSLFDVIENRDKSESNPKPYKAVVTTVYDKTGDGAVDMLDVAELFKSRENELSELEGDGDFRSEECLALLDEADIVVTNPPFSLFREYVNTLFEHQKHFIIIGNVNALTYKEIFPFFRDNKMWIGYRFNQRVNGKNMTFRVPDDYPLNGTEVFEDNGIKFVSVSGTGWFTNLDIKKLHEELILVKRYTPEEYPKYDNYDAIEVSKTADIPCDYSGIMGVPITFMDKYNPDQFEIIGLVNGKDYLAGIKTTKDYRRFEETRQDGSKTGSSGGKINGNPVLKGRPKSGNYFVFNEEVVHSTYARILIRNKHPEAPKEV